MVTTRSGACSSANHVATPGRQSNPEPPFNPDTPPRKKRARKSKAHKKKDFEEIPRSYGLMDMPDEIFAEVSMRLLTGSL
ncbi:unnamed protein product [Rhizoctonia solani]|uniref:Uncharacterized protein n=1 Tax=Rhizoctonia solani TaxID=456999 RepID=A0A8H3BYV1_9AGAM|nr:unnamed protein product [Rhizoctonia solani]